MMTPKRRLSTLISKCILFAKFYEDNKVYLLIVSNWSLTEVPPMHRAERRGGKPARWWETQWFNRYLFLPFQIWLIWKTAFNTPSCRVAHCNLSGNPRWKVLSRTTWHISCHWARLILIFLLCYISFYRKKVPRFSFFFSFFDVFAISRKFAKVCVGYYGDPIGRNIFEQDAQRQLPVEAFFGYQNKQNTTVYAYWLQGYRWQCKDKNGTQHLPDDSLSKCLVDQCVINYTCPLKKKS